MNHDYDYEEESQERWDARLLAAKPEIERFIKKQKVTTVGTLKRTFPAHEDIVWSVLKELKLEAKCDFDEYSPMPTKVYSRAMRRVQPMRYQSTSAMHRARVLPDAESITGRR